MVCHSRGMYKRGDRTMKLTMLNIFEYSMFFFLALLPTTCFAAESMLAVVCVPVADLVGEPLDTRYPTLGKTIAQRYHTLPYSGGTYESGIACPRVHQLLFNEIVTIVSMHEHQACITIPHLFYVTPASPHPQNMYWTLKSNLIPLDHIKQTEIHRLLPPAIDFSHGNMPCNKQSLVLIHPWQDPCLNVIYSAGTRFMYDPLASTCDEYALYRLNPQDKKIELIFIPKQMCIADEELEKHNKISLFVSMLKHWAHPAQGCIPYVWGGCSYCTVTDDLNFEEQEIAITKKKKTSWYTRPSVHAHTKTGFDCAGLIARAAQLSGIPYFYKNTLTLSLHLDTIKRSDKIKEGDLIWIPGHVMIVSSIKNNMLIEARSYSHGYGKVHEIELSRVFKDMHTYQDLKKAFFRKERLTRLDREGNPADSFKNFKILSFESVFKTKPEPKSINPALYSS